MKLDKAALQAALTQANEAVSAGFDETTSTTGSWKKFEQAKQTAEEALNKKEITQAQIDEIATALEAAVKGLKLHASSSDFEQSLNFFQLFSVYSLFLSFSALEIDVLKLS